MYYVHSGFDCYLYTHTYTYNPNIPDIVPCTANSCPGTNLSNYYIGTIEFSTTS